MPDEVKLTDEKLDEIFDAVEKGTSWSDPAFERIRELKKRVHAQIVEGLKSQGIKVDDGDDLDMAIDQFVINVIIDDIADEVGMPPMTGFDFRDTDLKDFIKEQIGYDVVRDVD